MFRPVSAISSSLLALSLLGSCAPVWTSDNSLGRLPDRLLGLGVAPDRATVRLGEELQFVATGYYSNRETRDLTDVVEWQSWRSDILSVSSSMDREGVGEPQTAGLSRVRASYMGLLSNEVHVAVTEAQVEQITLSPPTAELSVGQQIQLHAEASFSDGSRGNLSGSVRWITGDALVATLGQAGRLSAHAPGWTQIRALYESGAQVLEASPIEVHVAGQAPSLGPPDLQLVSVETEVVDSQVSWFVEVENNGERAATDLWIDAWLDRDSPPPPTPTAGDAWQILPFLGAGESRTVQLQLNSAAPGSYSSWLLVDSLATNFEGTAGEQNNTFGPEALTVVDTEESDSEAAADSPIASDEGLAPDLVISYFEGWADTDSDEVLYFIDVTNIGDEAAEASELAVFADLTATPTAGSITLPHSSVQIDSLQPGDTDYVSAVLQGTPDPDWDSYALIDALDSIAELLEENNYREFQVTR